MDANSTRLPVRFLGTGAYVPETVVTNEHFVKYLETSDDWIVTRTGIRERRKAAATEFTSTLAVHAAREALADAGMKASELGVIICATATGDYQFPSTAAVVQGELGAGNVPAMDVGGACAGFLYGTAAAAGMLGAGMYKSALVIGAETLTRFTDYEDRATAVLFGDGAGAAVLERSPNSEQAVLYSEMGCDGSKSDHIWVVAGGSRMPTSPTTAAERLHFLRMKGREVYKFAVVKMQELIDRALATTGLSPEDIKLVIPHQSNLRIIESVQERMKLPREKIVVHIDRYGNTSAASVIMGLHEARKSGKVKQGDHVLMVALGAGLVWGVMIARM